MGDLCCGLLGDCYLRSKTVEVMFGVSALHHAADKPAPRVSAGFRSTPLLENGIEQPQLSLDLVDAVLQHVRGLMLQRLFNALDRLLDGASLRGIPEIESGNRAAHHSCSNGN